MAKKVLIIEDDAWLADTFRVVAENHGWQVKITASAGEGMELIDDFQPKVVVLDFLLPLKNAPTLLNELQSHVDTAKLPIIVCSSLGDRLDPALLKHYGVQKVLDKATMTPDDLVKAMESFTHATA